MSHGGMRLACLAHLLHTRRTGNVRDNDNNNNNLPLPTYLPTYLHAGDRSSVTRAMPRALASSLHLPEPFREENDRV